MTRARSRILLLLLAACVAALPGCEATGRDAEPRAGAPRRLVVVSWDGAPDWVVDRLLADGKLPNVARLARSGARFDFSIPGNPSKTAVSHAALWTGVGGDVNGVTGNDAPVLPASEHTALEKRRGFDSTVLTAEPLYITAAKAGRTVVALSATHVYPPDGHLATLRAANVRPERFVAYSGFESSIEKGAVLGPADLRPATGWAGAPAFKGEARETSFRVGESEFNVLVYDDPADATDGLDTVYVRRGAKGVSGQAPSAVLKAAEARDDASQLSQPFRVEKGELFGNTFFRLFELAPDGTRFAFYRHAAHALRGTATREQTEKYLAAYGGFHDDPFFAIYEKGLLGKSLAEGGDGTAERRALEMVRHDVEFRKRGVRFAFEEYAPDVLFHYTPMIDGAGHTWMGALDPAGPNHDAELARKLWPFYERAFELEDEWLGTILDAAGESAVVCLVSDHGMAGAWRYFHPNVVLERAGLLARTAGGEIDLARTKILFAPWGEGFGAVVNGTGRKGGVVPPAEREAVLAAAERALLLATDPATGQRVVTNMYRGDRTAGLDVGGPDGSDLYIDVAEGYYPEKALAEDVATAFPTALGEGEHGYLPFRRKMHAICFMGGAGVPDGVELPSIRHIDVAPTLAKLIGIPAPKDARGLVALRAVE
jgi:predicted AlkP superfamily pyrophosphatase or phosphodiesterase